MKPFAFILSFTNQKNCFVGLPRILVSTLGNARPNDKGVICRISSKDCFIYSTWSGDVTSMDQVEINGLLATKSGFQHDQQVLVQLVPPPSPCSCVFLEPLSVDDWEILELHANEVEDKMLDQVSTVWPQQVLPIWIHSRLCIFMRIDRIEPSSDFCLLHPGIEVVVAARGRHGHFNPLIPNSDNKKSDVVDSSVADSSEVSKTKNNHSKSSLNVTPAGECNPDEDIGERKTHRHKSLLSRAGQYLSSWWFGDSLSEDGELLDKKCRGEELLPIAHAVPQDLDLALTVQSFSVDDLILDNLNDSSMINLVSQPTTVYISQSVLRPKLSKLSNLDEVPSCFFATLMKLCSPHEIRTEMKASVDKKSGPAGNDAAKSLLSDRTLSRIVVRVIVLDSEGMWQCEDCHGNQTAQVKFTERHRALGGRILVNDLLRRQLSLGTNSRVQIVPSTTPADLPSSIVIHSLSKKPDDFTDDMLAIAIKNWVSSVSDTQLPFVLNSVTMVTCMLKPEKNMDCAIYAINRKESTSENGLLFYLLNKESLDKTQVAVKESETTLPSLVEIDPTVPAVTLRQLGNVNSSADCLLFHLETVLRSSSLTEYVKPHLEYSPGRGVLLCGGIGTGKTNLAEAIAHQVAKHPTMAYITTIECKTLRGKRIESIRSLWEDVLNEAAWRQPSLLVLDDLDVLAGAPSGPEQEASGEVMYYNKLANVLCELLQKEWHNCSRVGVLATCRSRSSLSAKLVGSQGCHLFPHTVTLKPPDKRGRVEILQALMRNKLCVTGRSAEEVDLMTVAKATEGYVASDLQQLLDRAVHVCITAQKCATGCEITLSTENFQVAMDGFVPAALHDVPLHHVGSTSWHDVGGLHEVRQALVETLQWPAKYPELFATCPLRLRSGILLYGAPGTGKTLLAGAVATECGLNFISIKGPELLSKYIGASEQAVRDTFVRAQSAKPCILFFDEFDSLAPRRGHDSTGVTDRVVNQLLTQLDGVEGLEGVYVLAATSRPDLLDPALLRPGRLDKALLCPLPNVDERSEILGILTSRMTLADDVDLLSLSQSCEFFTGADLKALLYNAQLRAIHQVSMVPAAIECTQPIDDLNANINQAITEELASEDISIPVAHGGARSKTSTLNQHSTQTHSADVDVSTDSYTDTYIAGNSCESRIALYMETLEDEPSTPPPEYEQKFTVNSTIGETQQSSLNRPIEISQKHLLSALEQASPSVSEIERTKYKHLYESFIKSRSGNFSGGIATAKKRATLA